MRLLQTRGQAAGDWGGGRSSGGATPGAAGPGTGGRGACGSGDSGALGLLHRDIWDDGPRRQLRPPPTHVLGDQLAAPQGARDDLLEDVDDMMHRGGVALHEEAVMALSSARRPHIRW